MKPLKDKVSITLDVDVIQQIKQLWSERPNVQYLSEQQTRV